jgi:tetratricopeptide (TPR) repeat protein
MTLKKLLALNLNHMDWPLLIIIIILVALAIIAVIVVRKFPALAILDVENIPGEKESRFKKDIIKKRLDRDLSQWSGFFGRFLLFLKKNFSDPLYQAYDKLKQQRRRSRRGEKLSLSQRRKRIQELFVVAKENLEKEELELSEEALIEIISLEPKNLDAFWILADVYSEGKRWAEAHSTLEHALKLYRSLRWSYPANPEISRQKIYFEMALISKNLGAYLRSFDEVQEALELEPNNPRYLDLAVELAITLDKLNSAKDFVLRLKQVNPDNAKLAEWEQMFNLAGDMLAAQKNETENRVEELDLPLTDKTNEPDTPGTSDPRKGNEPGTPDPS